MLLNINRLYYYLQHPFASPFILDYFHYILCENLCQLYFVSVFVNMWRG